MAHIAVIEGDTRGAGRMPHLAVSAGAVSVDVKTTDQDAVNTALRDQPSIILPDGVLAAGTEPVSCTRIRQGFGDIPVILANAGPMLCESDPHACAVFAKSVSSVRMAQAFRGPSR